MVEEKSWDEFRKSGLLWWVNMILHTFGWSIVVDVVEGDGEVVRVYPARVKFRGFSESENTKGYMKVSDYLNQNAAELKAEAYE